MSKPSLPDSIAVKARLLGEHLSADHDHAAKEMTVRRRRARRLPILATRTMLWKLDPLHSLWIDKDGVLYREYTSGIGHASYCMKADVEKLDERRQSRILDLLENPQVTDWS